MAEFTGQNIENVSRIIGYNSKNIDLKSMVKIMVTDANTDELSAEYTLGIFLDRLINGLKPDSIPSEIPTHNEIPEDFRNEPTEYYIKMANKIKRTIKI